MSVVTGLRRDSALLKGAEVCDLLRIGRTTLHEWRVKGAVEGIRHHPRGPWLYPTHQPIIRQALRAVGRR